MPKPDPAQDAILAELRRLRSEREATDAQIARLEQAAQILAKGLHGSHFSAKVPRVQPNSASKGLHIAAGRKNQSESRKAQIRAGLTDKQVADKLGVDRSTVCKWHLGTMRIPDEHQAALQALGIPRDSWSNR